MKYQFKPLGYTQKLLSYVCIFLRMSNTRLDKPLSEIRIIFVSQIFPHFIKVCFIYFGREWSISICECKHQHT